MTVLRSREISPVQSPKLETLKQTRLIEPVTPTKIQEPVNNMPDPNPVHEPPRRRSLRLSSISSPDVPVPISTGSRKRKLVEKIGGLKENVRVLEIDTDTEKKNVNAGDFEEKNRVSEVEKIEEKVNDGITKWDLDTGLGFVDDDDGNKLLNLPTDKKVAKLANETLLSNGSPNVPVPVSNRSLKRKCVEKIGGSVDQISVLEITGDVENIEENVNVGVAEGNRNLDSDLGVVNDVGAKEVLSLRSGKKVVKRIVGCENECEDDNLENAVVDKGKGNLDIDRKFVGDAGGKKFLILRSGKKVVEMVIGSEIEGEGDKLENEAMFSNGIPRCSLNDGVSVQTSLSNENGGKTKFEDGDVLINDGVRNRMILSIEEEGKVNIEKDDVPIADGVYNRRNSSIEEKGKEKLANEIVSFNVVDKMEIVKGPYINEACSSGERKSLSENQVPEIYNDNNSSNLRVNNAPVRDAMERHRRFARKHAARFAHFVSPDEDEKEDEDEDEMPSNGVTEVEDWPGPFSTAMKIMKDRAAKPDVQQMGPSSPKSKMADVLWVPKKNKDSLQFNRVPPSLQEMCMEILVKHGDSIASLDHVPDVRRHELSRMLCDSRKMSSHILKLLLRGPPAEVRVKDCSWLSEEEFMKSFDGCDTNNLMVLQLDQCGRCMPDYVVRTALAQSPNSLPALTTISLKGGCRLSDIGLSSLVKSAPQLRSINLGQCSLLTSAGIETVADALGSNLRELYLDDCQNIDPMLVLPALKKLEHLEVLSLAGIQTVSDAFIKKFMLVCGQNMKELVLTDCVKLTDSSIKAIAENCPELCALDLVNVCKLTDSSIGYLANSCRQIEKLKLRCNAFSDEAIAAFVETSGELLKELSLNNVKKVGNNTALSLARCSRNLEILDLSFCRNMRDEGLGLIVDSCLSLRLLKLFGCTQVTNVFLDGHSNPQVKIIGMKLTPILKHLIVPYPEEGPLHYSSV